MDGKERTENYCVSEVIENVEHIIGEEDALIEWIDPDKSLVKFLPTASYELYKNDSCIYLFGRRGTGKTAIINMLDHQINNNSDPNYLCSLIVSKKDSYNRLTTAIRGSYLAEIPEEEQVTVVVKYWRWVLHISAMTALCKKYSNDQLERHGLISIKDYLSSFNIDIHDDKLDARPIFILINKFTNTFHDHVKNINSLSNGINKVEQILYDKHYSIAFSLLTKHLNQINKNILVIMDSTEVYNIKDSIARVVLSSLVQAALEVYYARATDRINVKATFPSEIFLYIKSVNYDKLEGRKLFIRWRYRDLVSFLAKRHYFVYSCDNPTTAIQNDMLKNLNYFENAREYLYQNMPATVKTRTGIKFDTLAYIISHTQKKPRQLISVMNCVLTLAKRNSDLYPIINEQCIRQGVHGRLNDLVIGVVQIYEQVYGDAIRIVDQVLKHARCEFPARFLDKLISNVHTLRSETGMSTDDVKRLLLDSGVIGLVESVSDVGNDGKKIIQVEYEYQIKDILEINNDSILALHPMMYQRVKARTDPDKYYYPIPSDKEELMLHMT